VLGSTIESEDIIHLEEVVTEATYIANHEVIKIIPVVYLIDDETKAKDPEGMEARKLELIADVFMIPKVFYTQLLDVFQKLDLHITDIVPNIL
jgi:cell division ATPase FtsA